MQPRRISKSEQGQKSKEQSPSEEQCHQDQHAIKRNDQGQVQEVAEHSKYVVVDNWVITKL
jgi:hypothetical protein